jgi:CheY-like chemotaxis protein
MMMMPAKILVVDDEPDLETLVTQKFRRRIRAGELAFVFAHDGQEALDVLEDETDVDMVLSDINMPRMDGLTLLSHLQSVSSRMRAVIVSAYGDMHNIRTAMNRGAFDFVTKPIDFDDLEATINKTLADLQILRELSGAGNRRTGAGQSGTLLLAQSGQPPGGSSQRHRPGRGTARVDLSVHRSGEFHALGGKPRPDGRRLGDERLPDRSVEDRVRARRDHRYRGR